MDAMHTGVPDAFSTEARERWGETNAYRQYADKTRDYSQDTWQQLAGDMDKIFAAFAGCMERAVSPDSPEAGEPVTALQSHITAHYYPCSDEMLRCLGQMYTQDARFRDRIDRHGTGTADYVCRAICAHCGK